MLSKKMVGMISKSLDKDPFFEVYLIRGEESNLH